MVKAASFALSDRNFRIYLSGNFVSFCCDWMDLVAINWIVLQISNSSSMVALVNIIKFLPVFLFSIPAGIVADRYDRKKTLIFLQLLMGALTILMSFTVGSADLLTIFLVIYGLRSCLNALLVPIRSAVTPCTVPQERLANAVAWHTTALNLATIVGPTIAGFVLALPDVAHSALFLINAVSFFTVSATLCLVDIRQKQTIRPRVDYRRNFEEVYTYVQSSPTFKFLIVSSSVAMFFGFSYTAILPIYVKNVLTAGPEVFGSLLAVAAAGSLAASLVMSFKNESGLEQRMIFSLAGFGVALICLALCHSLWQLYPIMLVIGYASQRFRTLNRTIMHLDVPQQLRGRMTCLQLMDRGLIPLGIAFLCILIEKTNVHLSLLTMGIGCLIGLYVAILQRSRLNTASAFETRTPIRATLK